MSGHKSKWPLKQVFDKLGEKPVPSLKFGEMPVPSLRQAFDKLDEIDLTLPEPPPPEPPALPTKPPPHTHKKGAGHPPALTNDEITRGQNIVRSALRESPKLANKKIDDLIEQFRPLFTLKRKVSDRTLWRHIIGPLVGPRRTKKPPA